MKFITCLLVFLYLILYHLEITYGQLEDALADSKQLNEPCKLDLHCAPKWSLCGRRTLKCDCWDLFIKQDNECFAAVQALCTEDSDCSSTLANSYCDQDKCKCRDTYTPDTDRRTCLSPKRFNETCKLDEECKLNLGQFGQCSVNPANYSSKICQCMQNYHPSNNGTCIFNVGMHGRCMSDEQCHTTGEIKLVCYDSLCRCPAGYISDDDRSCKDGAQILVQSFIFVLIMYGLTKIF